MPQAAHADSKQPPAKSQTQTQQQQQKPEAASGPLRAGGSSDPATAAATAVGGGGGAAASSAAVVGTAKPKRKRGEMIDEEVEKEQEVSERADASWVRGSSQRVPESRASAPEVESWHVC